MIFAPAPAHALVPSVHAITSRLLQHSFIISIISVVDNNSAPSPLLSLPTMVKTATTFSLPETAALCLLSACLAYKLALVSSNRDQLLAPSNDDDSKPNRLLEEREKTVSSDDNNNYNTSTTPNPSVSAELSSSSPQATRRTLEQDMLENNDGNISARPIGTIRSVYRLCVGTPRQGGLAPDARGRLELTTAEATKMVLGLESFSHVWVTFVFHLNLVGRKCPTKIAPPALGGKKVGVLATRSPHRPNPIGISLVQLESIETKTVRISGQRRPRQVTVLHLRGLDLVDGTPVLDVKPYVGTYDGPTKYRVPEWVSGGLDQQRHIEISRNARKDLETILRQHKLEFYDRNGIEDVLRCIEQVLAYDVRSGFKTNKARRQNENASNSQRLTTYNTTLNRTTSNISEDCFTQQLDNLLLHMETAPTNEASPLSSSPSATSNAFAVSGAEDHVVVTRIEWLGNQYQST